MFKIFLFTPLIDNTNLLPETSVDSKKFKYDFAPRYMDKDCYNIKAWKSIINSVIDEDFESLLSYGDPQGEYVLRCELAKYMYENKYNIITEVIHKHMGDNVNLISSSAGMRVILEINTDVLEAEIVKLAKEADINITPISKYYIGKNNYEQKGKVRVLISYKGIPTEDIEPAIKILSQIWFNQSKNILGQKAIINKYEKLF